MMNRRPVSLALSRALTTTIPPKVLMQKQKIVAAMIVRNEGHVLRRCLDSLRPYVDHVIVNDNGSTDDTQAVLESYGEFVVQVPGGWMDFSANRNLVLAVARKWGDYVLCGIDADEELVVPDQSQFPPLEADAYNIEVQLDTLRYPRVAIVKSEAPYTWKGVIQEGLYPPEGTQLEVANLSGLHILSRRDGARAKDPETQAKDLALLQKAFLDSPDNPRTTFYLAQQLRDMRKYEPAAMYYDIRISQGGWWPEVWAARYARAQLEGWMDRDPIPLFMSCVEHDPNRAEAFYRAADWLRIKERLNASLMFAINGSMLKRPTQGLFIEEDIYAWRCLDLIASVSWYTPHRNLGKEAARRLLDEKAFPESDRARIEANAKVYGLEATP